MNVGGDRQPGPLTNSIGATRFTGRLFRGDRDGGVWDEITHGGTDNDSSPHADSPDQEFLSTLGLGWAVFGDLPDLWAALGLCVLIVSGVGAALVRRLTANGHSVYNLDVQSPGEEAE